MKNEFPLVSIVVPCYNHEKYVKEIAGLYSDKDLLPIETEIRYQDGNTATLRTDLIIRTMKPEEAYQDLLRPKGFWKRLKGAM